MTRSRQLTAEVCFSSGPFSRRCKWKRGLWGAEVASRMSNSTFGGENPHYQGWCRSSGSVRVEEGSRVLLEPVGNKLSLLISVNVSDLPGPQMQLQTDKEHRI